MVVKNTWESFLRVNLSKNLKASCRIFNVQKLKLRRVSDIELFQRKELTRECQRNGGDPFGEILTH